jgi:hypothetical protein
MSIIIFTVFWCVRPGEAPDFSWAKIELKVVLFTIIAVVVVGLLLVFLLHIMWLDFLLIVFVLLLHRIIGEWWENRAISKRA